jgi:hypothetical protein
MEKHNILITFQCESSVAKDLLKQIDKFFTTELASKNVNFKISFFKEEIPISKQIINKLESIPENFSKKLVSSVDEAKEEVTKQEKFKEKFSSFVKEKSDSVATSSKDLLNSLKNKISKK